MFVISCIDCYNSSITVIKDVEIVSSTCISNVSVAAPRGRTIAVRTTNL